MVSGRTSENNDTGPSCDQPGFDNPNDEASYWKQIAEEYIQKLQDVRDEFDEFQEGSRELEAELEVQLEQYEHRVTELVNTKCKLEEENQMVKEKLDTLERKTYIQITELQDENIQVKTVRDEMQKYIRELEQCNDDLERAKRATICSLEEFDVRLNNAIERNAFLENELEEKEQLIITVQRLKDESRNLKGELAVSSQGRKSSLNESKLRLEERQTNVVENNPIDNKKQKPQSPKITEKTSESDKHKKPDSNSTFNRKIPSVQNVGNPMSPSARISALNIVSDLLRKVGALESKLARCRNFVQDHPQNGKSHILSGTSSITGPSSMMNGNGIIKKTNSNSNVSGLVKTNV